MAYLLFVDESGHDEHDTPFMALAGAAIQDRSLWKLILALQQAELEYFGCRYSAGNRELKGKKILKRKVFRHASQLPPIPPDERTVLARTCLQTPASAGRREITALAQAKLDYVVRLFQLCQEFRVKAVASIVTRGAPKPASVDHLRKDYSYLFERFFYLLEDDGAKPQGIVVFDELEKTQSHILLQQMDSYFKRTEKGRARSELVIPEPFFVHSELTSGIQVADLMAYVLAWSCSERRELTSYTEQIRSLQSTFVRDVDGKSGFEISSITKPIADLRPANERA